MTCCWKRKLLVNDVKQSETYPIDDILAKLQIAEAAFAKQEAQAADPMGEAVPPDARQIFALFDFNPQTRDKIATISLKALAIKNNFR